MPYHIGDTIEVLDLKDGNADIYFQGTIADLGPNHAIIEYPNVPHQNNQPLVEIVPIGEIRPVPARLTNNFIPGDDINARVDNGWLRGIYRQHQPTHPQGLVHQIEFPHMLEGQRLCSFRRNHVRLHQHFQFADALHNIGTWTYRQRTRMGYQVGDRIESIGFEDGMDHSFYEATVTNVLPHQLLITYETLQNDENEPLEELVSLDIVRPYPSRIAANYSPGDEIDVFYNDGWWSGTYDEYQPHNSNGLHHQIYFPYMIREERISSYRRSNIRLHQEFQFEDTPQLVGVWTYTKRI